MKTLKNIFGKRRGSFFNATNYELQNFFCGFGTCRINENEISIKKYPFKPSLASPNITLKAREINSITLKSSPPQLLYKNDWIFISANKIDELTEFADRNNIMISEKNWTWDNILEPFLDTEFTKEEAENTINSLVKNGISKDVVIKLREEVSKQMYKYNFDTMLWEWVSLGLSDVLQAMRVKYSDKEFQEFYKKAMSIENINATQHAV
ncbi:hypothetical protein [Flavivirga algicola]|uniref:Uncharacterized protein n=1 Tax=Flavivirga algicola TaxID=2729136 RepID=A0ABX1S3E2_9FLAO|nr:hypothetical protein [Flavivirga algicola]NMH89050.1 hypothetical protein [Flavivirga algicola]